MSDHMASNRRMFRIASDPLVLSEFDASRPADVERLRLEMAGLGFEVTRQKALWDQFVSKAAL